MRDRYVDKERERERVRNILLYELSKVIFLRD